jgi:hypothetical protein
MSKTATFLTLLVTVLVCSLPAAPGQAQSLRTFVSAAGSDSNNCTDVSTPCRHFFQAYAATSPGGEIDVLDPANYGGLIITQAISIEGFGWAMAATGSGTAVITINAAPSDKINIRGVVLDGFGFANNTGIQFNSGGSLNVQDSVIRNFANNGIVISPTAAASVLISNTTVTDVNVSANSSAGIALFANAGSLLATLDHVTLRNNYNGFTALAIGGSIQALIKDSVIDNSAHIGVNLTGPNNNQIVTSAVLRNVTLTVGTSSGIVVNRSAFVYLSQVTATSLIQGQGNNTSLAFTDISSHYASDGTNHLMGSVPANIPSWSTQ